MLFRGCLTGQSAKNVLANDWIKTILKYPSTCIMNSMFGQTCINISQDMCNEYNFCFLQ